MFCESKLGTYLIKIYLLSRGRDGGRKGTLKYATDISNYLEEKDN